MKAHEYWFSHYGVRRNPGIFFLYLFTLQKISKIMSDFVSPNTTAALFKNSFFHTDFSISDSLKSVRKSVLIYETIIVFAALTYIDNKHNRK